MNWYALHCRSNTEHLVVRQLADAGIQSFFAHRKTKSKYQKRETVTKFFPGYTFAQFDLANDRRKVIALTQVVGILGWEHQPVAIPDPEIASIQLMMTAPPEVKMAAGPVVLTGAHVEIMWGALAGLQGVVTYSRGGAAVRVNVPGLNRSISAVVDRLSLRVLEPMKFAA